MGDVWGLISMDLKAADAEDYFNLGKTKYGKGY